MPLVSVLTPTYDRVDRLPGAIRTVRAQTHDDVEHVVVNDGSTDGTRAYLDGVDDDRVRVRHNDGNRGIAYSFNRAADAADGEFYCILGDDDRWHPEKVDRQLAAFREADDRFGVAYTGGVLTAGGRVSRRYRPTREGNIYPEILAAFGLHPHSGHMLTREAFEAAGGFDEAMERGVDWEMCVRLARVTEFLPVPGVLVQRPRHGGAISDQPEQTRVHDYIYEKYREEFAAHPAVDRAFRANRARIRAYNAARAGERRPAVREAATALRLRPSVAHLGLLLTGLVGRRSFDLAARLRRAVADARADDAETDAGAEWWAEPDPGPDPNGAATRV
ncbi:glycosyltransferase family 2 protein [Candidatus Halobonum tyrrellensis]|uniref:Glycosyl transferase n=1 Tax=Candidatus Halobonum tyrrellensis G22 TaxID=1324957 RepID=V4HA57_9EURY|nr:glycosyltransferase [Candidatus Halobonum tyrrellensis]ESP86933.1 glycosyl transferase [Candidatus Halobonum tyrrellensis G22]